MAANGDNTPGVVVSPKKTRFSPLRFTTVNCNKNASAVLQAAEGDRVTPTDLRELLEGHGLGEYHGALQREVSNSRSTSIT